MSDSAASTPLNELPPLVNRGLSRGQQASICRYLLLNWKIEDIVAEVGVSKSSVYRIRSNLTKHGSVKKPRYRVLGRARKLSQADEDALFEYLLREPWRHQDELVMWLYNERNVHVSRVTVCRTIQRRNWSLKNLKQIAAGRNEDELRRGEA